MQQVLEDTLGTRCSVMKTTSSDPVEAMLAAAACSHVVVVYPTFPMRRRPTAADDKALLAVSCYVELALREKERALHERLAAIANAEHVAGGGGGGSRPSTPASAAAARPRIEFVGAYCVVQPPPGDTGGGGLIGGSPVTAPDSPPTATGLLLPPTLGASTVDKAVRLPSTFAEVAGAGGLFQALTGKKQNKPGDIKRRKRAVSVVG